MPISKTWLALAAVAGVVALGAVAYEQARPKVHPIKEADALKYALNSTDHVPELVSPEAATDDRADTRADLFGRAQVIDGDTLKINGVEADLWTIEAPELAQTCEDKNGKAWACGEASRAHLEKLIGGRQVACRPEGPPPTNGRWLGVCYMSDTPCQGDTGHCESDLGSLNLAQVTNGWAADFEGQYADNENDAQEARLGVWAGHFETPSERRSREAQVQAEAQDAGT